MPYDIFISYAHQGDNTSREAVAALVARLHAELEADFRRRFNRDLEIFFDKTNIRDFHHWQVQCHRALRDSRFFIACLSRSYLRSDACRWEWEEWCKHEHEHGLIGQGAASLWFVKLEDLETPENAELLSRWKNDLLQRFHVQCHEWRPGDAGAFLDAAARAELQQLTEHVAQRLRLLTLDRARRGNLPWPHANFVGREAELASLRAALLDAPEPSPAGIHGVGGMGKTALAQAFAYHEADAFPSGCWLLRCEGRDRLLTVFRTLVPDLEIELTDEEKLDDAKAVRRVFDVLRARGPALFFLDNVDRPALLAREQMALLAGQPWARVLYTTRLAPDEFTKAGAMIRPLDLDRLPENQAVDLIRRYQPGQAFASPEHEAAAREIVRELSGLTLAVETAAVYLGQCDSRVAEPQYAVDARNYLNKLREDLKTGGGAGVMNLLREVTATLRPTLARLDAPARTVLQIASLLPPDSVALPWVRAIAGQSHPELAADAATGESDPWTQLIRGLIGMRLFQPTAEPRVVAIHRILQRVLETELSEVIARQEDASAKIPPLVTTASPTTGLRARLTSLFRLHSVSSAQTQVATETAGREIPINARARGILIAHVLARGRFLFEQWENTNNRWEIEPLRATAWHWMNANEIAGAMVAQSIQQPLCRLCLWGDTEQLLRRALELYKRHFGSRHERVGIACNNLAEVLRGVGHPAEAEAFHRRALEILDEGTGENISAIGQVLNNRALSLAENGHYFEAEILYRRALAIAESVHGPNHLEVARALSNLGQVLCETSRPGEAEESLRRALTIVENQNGANHPLTTVCRNNLAGVLDAMNRFDEAETLYRHALAADEASFGRNNSMTALRMHNLAHVLIEKGLFDEAKSLLHEALAAQECNLPANHPELATTMAELGVLFGVMGRLDDAESHLSRALVIFRQAYGSDHPRLAVCLNNLAGALCKAQRLTEAEPLYQECLRIHARWSSRNRQEHPRLSQSASDYHAILRQVGHGEETARRLVKGVLAEEGMK